MLRRRYGAAARSGALRGAVFFCATRGSTHAAIDRAVARNDASASTMRKRTVRIHRDAV